MNHDEANAANALESLASHANTTGALPKALAYRARFEAIHGRLGDRQSLPYDIALRADLLIRLGRGDEAQPLFVDLDNGRAAGIDAYRNRSRRAEALRALRAVIAQNFPDAAGRSEALLADRTRNDSAHDLATVLLWYARARQGASHVPPTAYDGLDRDPNDAEPRELAYWEAMAHVASGDPRRALAVVERDFATVAVGRSDERDWRMAAIGTVAANAIHDGDRMERLRGIARAGAGTIARRLEGRSRHVSVHHPIPGGPPADRCGGLRRTSCLKSKNRFPSAINRSSKPAPTVQPQARRTMPPGCGRRESLLAPPPTLH